MPRFPIFLGAATVLFLYKQLNTVDGYQLTVNRQLLVSAQTKPVFKGFLAIFFGN